MKLSLDSARVYSLLKGVLFVAVVAACHATAQSAPTIAGGSGAGVTTDSFDVAQGGFIISSSPLFGGSNASDSIGDSASTLAPTFTFFSDGLAVNSPSTIHFGLPSPIDLTDFALRLQQDGASSNRSANAFTLRGSTDNINFTTLSTAGGLSNYQTNFGSPQVLITDNVTLQNAQFFELEVTRATTFGPRIAELDGFGTAPTNLLVDANVFNATTNVNPPGEPAGLSLNFSSSAPITTDTVEDAFGNNDGNVEPTSFIFADGGTADNGNGSFGDGGETVDFIEWETTSLADLAGYQINLSGDGGGTNRATELVRFLVEGVEVDLFDNDAHGGTIDRIFAGGPVTGDMFRIEFTRTGTNGPRIFEVNAILAPAVPEPGSLAIFSLFGMMTLLGLAWRRRRGSGR